MKTTLITAIGSAAAGPVNDRLHALGHRVIGCDLYPRAWNAVSGEVDEFFQIEPASNTEAYLCRLFEAVERYRPDYLIPLTDVEVDVLCPLCSRLATLGCALCAPDASAARLCRDKQAMAQRLSSKGICRTIPTFSPYSRQPKPSEYPLMLKPLRGRSSQGQSVAHNQPEYAIALASRPDLIAQPYLKGDVYTVDVARDAHGQTQALARRELLRTQNGLGTTVETLPEHPLNAICARIAETAGIVGVVNMEFISQGDDYYFLEVNPRFSGGIGFSVAAGIDFPALALLCRDGAAIGPRKPARALILTRKISLLATRQL